MDKLLDDHGLLNQRRMAALQMFTVNQPVNFVLAFGERPAKPVVIVALVGKQLSGGRQRIEHQSRALVIAHLAFAEQHDDGAPLTVADGMQL